MTDYNLFKDNLILFAEAIFAVSLFRYIVLAGGMFAILYIFGKERFKIFKIQLKEAQLKKTWGEMKMSVFSIVAYTAVFCLTFWFSTKGWNRMYFDLGKFPIWYTIFSTLLLLAFHETYFYWTHRAIHTPFLMKKVHKVHHYSNNPTMFAALAMHPVEALVEYSYIFIVTLLFPINFYILLLETLVTFCLNLLWHSGFEFFPEKFASHKLFSWINTSTHHNLHHQRPLGNYSLYTNFWDRVCNTNRKDYLSYFDKVKGQNKNIKPIEKEKVVAA